MSPGLLLALVLAVQTGPAPPAAPAATPAPPPAAATPPPAEWFPRTDWPPSSLFTDDDYPAAALRGDEQGKVRFHVEIGANGRVSNCAIRASSGSAALDLATCRIVTSRARFVPARDSDGHPVPDARDGEVTWRLPDE